MRGRSEMKGKCRLKTTLRQEYPWFLNFISCSIVHLIYTLYRLAKCRPHITSCCHSCHPSENSGENPLVSHHAPVPCKVRIQVMPHSKCITPVTQNQISLCMATIIINDHHCGPSTLCTVYGVEPPKPCNSTDSRFWTLLTFPGIFKTCRNSSPTIRSPPSPIADRRCSPFCRKFGHRMTTAQVAFGS